MDRIAAFLAGPGVLPPFLLRNNPMPTPLGGGVGVLTIEGGRHFNAPRQMREVLISRPPSPPDGVGGGSR